MRAISWQKMSRETSPPSPSFAAYFPNTAPWNSSDSSSASPNQGTGKKFLSEIADRAFGEYGAHRLFLDVFVNNDRALHVYEAFGFRKEGIMRDAIYRDGSYHSLVLMSLLDGERNA
ncbi:MAG TPA: GNAT family protein [Acidobacteriaceae bacterium]|nr:GNAT family protein [Acidobacteriaceae bacterium]